ncbi:zinc ABC transporter substrate-binding protein [Candidatus Uhrbacteria bacterium]|jgi:zinc transport system substrate-binding protein|nr:zinc ABC transporter substrate-binding protein [Candidatus Uhrbacteria bacterium]
MTDVGHKRAIGFVLGLIMVVLIIVIAGAVSSRVIEPPSDRVSVAATIFPVADIVSQVAGDLVDVELILDPGASPHTFELTPRKATRLSNVDRIFAIGQGVDAWAMQVASISDADVVELDQYTTLICEGTCDPHFWLSIPRVIELVDDIAIELATIDPDHADTFTKNAKNYIAELTDVHRTVDNIMLDAPSRDLIVFHDSWNYFAEAYGLKIRGTFEPSPGREPSPKSLAELEDLVTEYSINRVYKEPQLSDKTLEPFVNDQDVEIGILDPLGGVEDRTSYIDLMIYNAHAIAAP